MNIRVLRFAHKWMNANDAVVYGITAR